MFPDKATLFIGAIEDGNYKDEKIHCKTVSVYDSNRLARQSQQHHQFICCTPHIV